MGEPEQSPAKPPSESRERVLTRRFLGLPYRHQVAAARAAGLLEGADMSETDEELWRAVFRRAGDLDRVEQLWAEVEKRMDLPP